MYLLLFFVLVLAGVALAALGRARGRSNLLWGGIALAVAAVLLFSLLDFWGEVLWFEAVGFAGRLWTVVGWQAGAVLIGALIAGAAAAILSIPARRLQPIVSPWAELAGAAGGGVWAWVPGSRRCCSSVGRMPESASRFSGWMPASTSSRCRSWRRCWICFSGSSWSVPPPRVSPFC